MSDDGSSTGGGDVYRALVADLAYSLVPTSIMGFTLVSIGLFAAAAVGETTIAVGAACGGLASLAKILLLVLHSRRNRRGPVDARETRRWEAGHGISTLAVAASVSTVATMAFLGPEPSVQLLGTALLFGYCSGVVTRLSIRPWIACAALTVVVCPAAIAAAAATGTPHRIVAIMFVVFLVGGYDSVRFTYRTAVRQIVLRLDMARLAQRDPLTGLHNRLGLRDTFRAPPASAAGVAVHCFDLDGFKAVNDAHGHAAGDVLLEMLAGRLRALLTPDDVAARMGGDEFVVVQRAPRRDDAASLARRIAAVLAEPYAIGSKTVRVGISLGYACSASRAADLDAMLAEADAAAYRAKRRGGGVFRDAPEPSDGSITNLDVTDQRAVAQIAV